jgi:hypothetical protein
VRIPKPACRPALPITLAVLALALAACGSSTQTGTGSGSGSVPGLRYAQCMRAHGVPNYPDPGGAASGPSFAGSGLDVGSPAFKAAQQACAKFAVGLPGAPNLSASRRRALVAFAKCMRANGVPSFPDPLLTAPSAPSNGTSIIDLHGAIFELPAGTDLQSPALKRAGAECGVDAPS